MLAVCAYAESERIKTAISRKIGFFILSCKGLVQFFKRYFYFPICKAAIIHRCVAHCILCNYDRQKKTRFKWKASRILSVIISLVSFVLHISIASCIKGFSVFLDLQRPERWRVRRNSRCHEILKAGSNKIKTVSGIKHHHHLQQIHSKHFAGFDLTDVKLYK